MNKWINKKSDTKRNEIRHKMSIEWSGVRSQVVEGQRWDTVSSKFHTDTTGFQLHYWPGDFGQSTGYKSVDSTSVPLHAWHLSSGKD